MKKKFIVACFLHIVQLLILSTIFTCSQPADTDDPDNNNKYIIEGNIKKTVTSFSRIEAVVSGDNGIDTLPKIEELWFNASTNGFSGYFYLSKTEDINNYSVYVNVYSVDSVFIGRSVTVNFNSLASIIKMPIVDPMNAYPSVFAGNDTALSIIDYIFLHAVAVDSFGGTIEKWEWDIENTGILHPASGGDTLVFLPESPDSNYACIVRVTDNDGFTDTDTIIIAVLFDAPVPTASSTTPLVTINDSIFFLGNATDEFGEIVKWEWDVGNTGTFVETTPDSNYSTVAPATADSNYLSRLRVMDDDGIVQSDLVCIKVIHDIPVPTASTTTPKVSIYDSIKYYGTATDLGRIVKWEWDIGNTGTLIESTPDSNYFTTASSTGANPYSTILKVTDEDSATAVAVVNINVEQDAPVPTASTTTPEVYLNDTITLFGTATDEYGRIVKWEWDAGNTGTFFETTPDSNYISLAPGTTDSNYLCLLRVTDDDNNVALDTVIIIVSLFYSQKIITTEANGTYEVYAIDIDGDTDIDVLSASLKVNSKIAWYENDGSQQFTAHTITTSANGASSVFAIDIDRDTDIDVLSASMHDNKIAWYENDGTGNFTDHTISTSAYGAYSVFAIDIDGDTDIDVLSASADDNKIAWYENDGVQNFTDHTITTSADAACSAYAIDVDGDGDIDILSASINDDKIAWYENNGSQQFVEHIIDITADGARSVFAIDIDGDADIDILSASCYDNKITWYENDGAENFTTHNITTSAYGANSVKAVDLDGDEDIDVLSASVQDNKIAWYENDGAQNFTADIISTSAYGAYSIFTIDVDDDTDVDVLSASWNDNKIAWYENSLK